MKKMTDEIYEISEETTIRIGGIELSGRELKHHLANGLRYEKLSEQLVGVSNEH